MATTYVNGFLGGVARCSIAGEGSGTLECKRQPATGGNLEYAKSVFLASALLSYNEPSYMPQFIAEKVDVDTPRPYVIWPLKTSQLPLDVDIVKHAIKPLRV